MAAQVKTRLNSQLASHGSSHGRAVWLRALSSYTPGGLLQVGDRADLIGLFSIKGRPAKAYVLIQNLRVIAIGGRSESPDDRPGVSSARDSAARVYRSFTVELKPEVAVQLADLMPRIEGKLWLAVRNPTDNQAQFDNKLNPEVEALLSNAPVTPGKPGQ